MSDECDSYESACSRAELLGSAPPSRHEWELANKDKGTTSATDDVTEVFIGDDVIHRCVCCIITPGSK